MPRTLPQTQVRVLALPSPVLWEISTVKSIRYRLPSSVASGQLPQRTTRSQNPQHAIARPAVVLALDNQREVFEEATAVIIASTGAHSIHLGF